MSPSIRPIFPPEVVERAPQLGREIDALISWLRDQHALLVAEIDNLRRLDVDLMRKSTEVAAAINSFVDVKQALLGKGGLHHEGE